MSEKIWVQSKWKLEELQAESVEFKLPVQDGEVTGIGQFVVTDNSEGQLSINIRTNLKGEGDRKDGMHDFHLNQWATDQIERNRGGSEVAFRCGAA